MRIGLVMKYGNFDNRLTLRRLADEPGREALTDA